MEMLSDVKAGYEGILSSMSKLGAINISYMEKIAEKQMASSKFVADLGFEQMKAITGIDSLEAAKNLPSSSLETGSKLAKKTMEDSKAMIELGSNYKAEVSAIFKKADAKATA